MTPLDNPLRHAHPLVQGLLDAPSSHLEPSLLPVIRKWGDPPKAIEVLEVLDRCIFASLASGTVLTVLQALYKESCEGEGTTHEDVVKLATWRGPEPEPSASPEPVDLPTPEAFIAEMLDEGVSIDQRLDRLFDVFDECSPPDLERIIQLMIERVDDIPIQAHLGAFMRPDRRALQGLYEVVHVRCLREYGPEKTRSLLRGFKT